MGKDKKSVRLAFRYQVLKRDKNRCRVCGSQPGVDKLDVHHIVNRKDMPAGGYVAANGIALCSSCHIKAEDTYFHRQVWLGYSPPELYLLIGSSHKDALKASQEMKLLQDIFGVVQ